MAKTRSSGSGLVVALVIFILLAVTGTGLSIYFYQQLKISEQAVETNQSAFKRHIGDAFDQAGWEMPEHTRSEYGIIYDEDTYQNVAEKLMDAAEFEQMQPLLPWTASRHVEGVLEDHAVEDDPFNTVEGLLDYYAQQYDDLTRRTTELNRRNRNFIDELEEKDAELSRLLTEKNRKIEDLESGYRERLEEINAQYAEMVAKWEEAREHLWPSFENLRAEKEEALEMERKGEELRQELAGKIDALEQKLTPPEPDRLEPEGDIIAYERGQDIAIVSGGDDMERSINDRFVIFRTNVEGKPVITGRGIVSRVYETTSKANVKAEPSEVIMEGQNIVETGTWEAVFGGGILSQNR